MNNMYIKFIEEATEAINNFPDLQLCSREDSLPLLEGKITLFDEIGGAYDSYFIKIECCQDYPNSFPFVYETLKRLPHNIDWHVYGDGHFCICTPIEEFIHCAKGYTLKSFIQDQVLPYLHNQSFREKEGYFLNERSHGSQGILESLYDILSINDVIKIHELLVFIYKNSIPLRTSKCFCGSNKKFRYCHKESYHAIKSIGPERLFSIISYIKRLIAY
jgi:hypothetical protein